MDGNVNVFKFGKKFYLIVGCGGFVDIMVSVWKIVFFGLFEVGVDLELMDEVFIVKLLGKFIKMVDEVEYVMFFGWCVWELG